MSESQNYFAADIGFHQCKKFLNSNGYLLVSGKFRRSNINSYTKLVTNVENEYVKTAKTNHFHLIELIDISKQTLPNLQLAQTYYMQYAQPLINLSNYYLNIKPTFFIKLLKIFIKIGYFFFRKKINQIQEFYSLHLDPNEFTKHVSYKRMLFKYNPL